MSSLTLKMEFIRALLSGGNRKAPVKSVAGESLQVPYLGDMNDIRTMPVPGSGMDRADWFANSVPNSDVRANAIFSSSTRVNLIGSNQRGVDGPVRGEEWTDGYFTGYIDMAFPEEKTRNADDLGSFWDTQVGSSKGLNVPGEDQVYVDQDTQSVWT